MRNLALSITNKMLAESESSRSDKYATKLRVLVGMISVLLESHEMLSFASSSGKPLPSSSRHSGWYAGDPSILGWFI